MKAYLAGCVVFIVSTIGIYASPLSEEDAVNKVKNIPQLQQNTEFRQCVFDDNELLGEEDSLSPVLQGSYWRIDARKVIKNETAGTAHVSLWNRFMVNAGDGSVMVWDRLKGPHHFIPLKEWMASQKP